jgi:hypothetical protein
MIHGVFEGEKGKLFILAGRHAGPPLFGDGVSVKADAAEREPVRATLFEVKVLELLEKRGQVGIGDPLVGKEEATHLQ